MLYILKIKKSTYENKTFFIVTYSAINAIFCNIRAERQKNNERNRSSVFCYYPTEIKFGVANHSIKR